MRQPRRAGRCSATRRPPTVTTSRRATSARLRASTAPAAARAPGTSGSPPGRARSARRPWPRDRDVGEVVDREVAERMRARRGRRHERRRPRRARQRGRASSQRLPPARRCQGRAVEAVRERQPQRAPPSARRPRGQRGQPGVVEEQRVERAEAQRAARPPQPGARLPAAVSAHPSASAERTLGASAQARRASATARAGLPWSASKSASSTSVFTPARAQQRLLRAHEREVAPRPRAPGRRQPASPSAMTYSGSGSRSTTPRQRAIAAGVSPRQPSPSEPGLGGRRSPARRPGRAVRAPRGVGVPRWSSSPPSSALHVGHVLRRRAAGGDGQPHRGRRAGEVAVQLAEVGHARVGGEVGLAVDHAAARGRRRCSGRARRARRRARRARRRVRRRGRAARSTQAPRKSWRESASVPGSVSAPGRAGGRAAPGRGRRRPGCRRASPVSRTFWR